VGVAVFADTVRGMLGGERGREKEGKRDVGRRGRNREEQDVWREREEMDIGRRGRKRE